MPALLDLSSGTKVCTKCGVTKSVDDFYRNSRPSGFPRCKTCTLEYDAARRERPGAREASRRRQLKHHLRKQYGMTMDDYESFLIAQQCVCAICGQAETALGRGGEVKPLAVDHDHKTGAIRGLLCHRCNSVLGNAQDDADRLEAAARYLRRAEPFRK